MGEWSQEWFNFNAKPIVDAIKTKDLKQVSIALLHMPKTYWEYIQTVFERSPEHVIIETLLIVFVLYVMIIKKPEKKNKTDKLSKEEVAGLVDEWEPEPLVSDNEEEEQVDMPIVCGMPNAMIQLKGNKEKKLNFATMDFIGMLENTSVREGIVDSLTEYGCGSCGPRGFYGTLDVHEGAEKDITAFLNTEDSIIYSDSEATITSIIPAFANRGDLIVIDKGCADAILVGAQLARCNVLYYDHNDMSALNTVLKSILKEDAKVGRKADAQRRYVVTEGLFRNTGNIVDLPRLLKICKRYCFRIILDESYSIGVLGDTGRGCCEYFDVDIMDVDVISGSLANAFGSVGGFSTGSQIVVDNQRINSSSYVFSASAPPFTSKAVSDAIQYLNKHPKIVQKLHQNVDTFHTQIYGNDHFEVVGHPDAPIVHLQFQEVLLQNFRAEYDQDWEFQVLTSLKDISAKCLHAGLAIHCMQYKRDQLQQPLPTLRFVITSYHDKKHITDAISIFSKVASDVIGSLSIYKTKKIPEAPAFDGDTKTPSSKGNTNVKSKRGRKPKTASTVSAAEDPPLALRRSRRKRS